MSPDPTDPWKPVSHDRDPLDAVRHELNLDRKELAALLGVDPAILLAWERGSVERPPDLPARLKALRSKGTLLRVLDPIPVTEQATRYMRRHRAIDVALLGLFCAFFAFAPVLRAYAWFDSAFVLLGMMALMLLMLTRIVGVRGARCPICRNPPGWLRLKCKSCGVDFDR